jgi:endonuclease YncB( thermonuclease family)
VRLSAIDTPEYDQPYGSQASAALKALLPLIRVSNSRS